MNKKTVTVDAKALYAVLRALMGSPHEVRELQATMGIPGLTGRNPILVLRDEYIEQVIEGGEDNETA